MRKKDLLLELTETGLTDEQASAAIEAILHAIKEALADGKVVQLAGFGEFTVEGNPGRLRADPGTGEKVVVSARRVPLFKPAEELEQIVEGS